MHTATTAISRNGGGDRALKNNSGRCRLKRWCRTLQPSEGGGKAEVEVGDAAGKDPHQWDQMVRLFFSIGPFKATKIISTEYIWQWNLKILPSKKLNLTFAEIHEKLPNIAKFRQIWSHSFPHHYLPCPPQSDPLKELLCCHAEKSHPRRGKTTERRTTHVGSG